MAKQAKPRQEKQNHIFTNSLGESFKLFPLNPLEEDIIRKQVESEWQEAGRPLPEPPSYELTTVTGETQRVSLKSEAEADTPELKAAWETYQSDKETLAGLTTLRFLDSCFLCIDADPDDCPGWKRRMAFLKIQVPEDDADKFRLFCNTWVIRSKEDIVGLIIAASRTVSNVSEEVAQAAEARFRRAMEENPANLGLAEGTGGG